MKRALLWGGAVVVAALIAIVGWGLAGSEINARIVRARDGRVPSSIDVRLDGKQIQTQDGALQVNAALGKHTLAITAKGYETVVRDVTLGFYQGADLKSVGLRNADLSVSFVENFPGFAPVKGARVALGERSVVATDGTAVLSDLPLGEMTVEVQAKGSLPGSMTIGLVSGDNSVIATLTPDLLVVVDRAAQNVIDRDLALTYQLLHPARQKQWGTQAQYVALVEKRDKKNAGLVSIKSFKVLTPTHLVSYRDGPSKTTYHDVYKAPVRYTVSSPLLALFGQSSMSMTLTDYWIQVDGQWRDIGNGSKVSK